MKKLTLSIITLIIALTAAVPTSAQLKFGLKAGINVNSLKFDETIFDSDNRAGFNGGAMVEFTVPGIGIGFDASAMYVHRTTKFTESGDKEDVGGDYIEIPVNLKWKVNIPAVNRIIRPYLTTGPSVAFLVSDKKINDLFKNNSYDVAWNFGFGVELFQHVQVSASYGLGLTNVVKMIDTDGNYKSIDGKNKYWTVTAAYLF